MSSAPLDVVGVGNAIVDVLAKCEEAFLARHAVPKGGMILIDEDQAEGIYGEMAQTVEVSGG
ncbi:MAG: adenosine kinase, partial [Pseudomonadota bacterium]